MTDIYKEYFQKSKVFLYPLIGIRPTQTINALNTYISWGDRISELDYKLIVTFKEQNTDGYKAFEKLVLLKNKYFSDIIECEDNIIAYIFSFEKNKEDWDYFLVGRYSQLSLPLKGSIKNYFNSAPANLEIMNSYLHPIKFYGIYADILSVDKTDIKQLTKSLKQAGELCIKYDQDKEDFKGIIKEYGSDALQN